MWLGIDHGWGKGRPIIFETMVFLRSGRDDQQFDEYQRRYSTEAEALAGHAETLAAVQAGLTPGEAGLS